MFVIGVAGQAQMGKDTLSDFLAAKLNEAGGPWKRSAFASAVKKVFCEVFDVDLDFVEKWKVIPEPPPGFDMPVRQALQFIGDGFRKIKGTIWLDLAFRNKEISTIISDVRYINEFTRVKKEGGLNIIIARPEKLNYDSNESEAQIRPYVNWLMNRFKKSEEKVVDLTKFDWKEARKSVWLPPDNIELFDLFVLNDGDTDDLYCLIEEKIVPLCQNFKFNKS
jgi:hypothetical protein